MIRQIHTCAALNVSPQYRSLVGIPTFHDSNCNQSHKEKSVCKHCRWNMCQGCEAEVLSHVVCFTGWTGYCGNCVAPAKLQDVPDEWKEFYTEKAATVGAGKARKVEKEEVIVITDEEEQALEQTLEQLRCEFPFIPNTWEIPESGDIREYSEFKLFNAEDEEINPKYVLEILTVVDGLIAARRKSTENKDPIPHPFGKNVPPDFFTIQEITRIQNSRQTRMYKTAIEEATYNNEKRKPPNKASRMEDVAFHGTNEQCAMSIAKSGPHTKSNKNGSYGWGVYLSLNNFAIPLVYADNSVTYNGGNLALVMGMSLSGKKSPTPQYQAHPNAGNDTGGCGNDWIHVVFDDYHFNPEYVIVFRISTQQNWEDQVKEFQDAAVVVGSSPFKVMLGIAGISKADATGPAAASLQPSLAWPGLNTTVSATPKRAVVSAAAAAVSASSLYWPVLSTASPPPLNAPGSAVAGLQSSAVWPFSNNGPVSANLVSPNRAVVSAPAARSASSIYWPVLSTAVIAPAAIIPVSAPVASPAVIVPVIAPVTSPAVTIPVNVPVASPAVSVPLNAPAASPAVIVPPSAPAASPVVIVPPSAPAAPVNAPAAAIAGLPSVLSTAQVIAPVKASAVPAVISPPKARATPHKPAADKRTPKKACPPSQYKATPPTSDESADTDSDDPGYKPGVRARK